MLFLTLVATLAAPAPFEGVLRLEERSVSGTETWELYVSAKGDVRSNRSWPGEPQDGINGLPMRMRWATSGEPERDTIVNVVGVKKPEQKDTKQ